MTDYEGYHNLRRVRHYLIQILAIDMMGERNQRIQSDAQLAIFVHRLQLFIAPAIISKQRSPWHFNLHTWQIVVILSTNKFSP
mmetsp:Transcript_22899/g.32823  ORF Transcript_22899/g.32823 Transcript_22899/m.32823 type:complete len:83 (-) Transcript_22899:923-1171(-)